MYEEIKCPVCHKKGGIKDKTFGILVCASCQRRRAKNKLPDQLVEFTSESIKQDRTEYASSIVQPFNKYGEFSQEYYEAHGTKGVKITPSQLKNRRRLWDKAISSNVDITKTK